MSSSPWLPALTEHLGTEPTTTDEIVDLLVNDHPDIDEDDVAEALEVLPNAYEFDGGWVDLLQVADGVVLTHTLSDEERDQGVLDADVDLRLWAQVAQRGLPLAGGGSVVGSLEMGHILEGPEGWLDAYQSGTLISMRLQDGVIELTRCDYDSLDSK